MGMTDAVTEALDVARQQDQINRDAIAKAFTEVGATEERAKSQAFFAQLAAEMRRPSFGALQRDFLEALLIRAEEAKLYLPERP